MTKGTKKRKALKIAQDVENMAGQMEGFSGKNSFGLRLEMLSEYLNEGLDLFAELLLEPAWDREELEKEKKLSLEAIKNQEDNLSSLAFYHFQKALFGRHPYGMRIIGEKESIKKISPKALQELHRKAATASNMVLGVVGDFRPAELLARLEKKLSRLPQNVFAVPSPPPAARPSQTKKVAIRKEKEQSHLVLGFLGPGFKDPDRYPMTVLNTILSGMGGRLFVELRDKLSLAYSVTSIFQPGLDTGYFAVYLGTEPSKVKTALKAIEAELTKVIAVPVSKEELEKTKNHLAGTYELELQRNTAQAQSFAFDELYGLGFEEVLRYPEKILQVSEEDVLAAAKKYITPGAGVLSLVGP